MSELWGLSTDEWTAIGSVATAGALIIAALAVLVAFFHLLHARRASAQQLAQDRRAMEQQFEQARQVALDQSRPYVIIHADLNPAMFSLLDLVIKNVGAGPARDVEIQVDPPLRRAKQEPNFPIADARIFTEPIEMLLPGFELRKFFDSAIDRNGAGMPSRQGHAEVPRWSRA